MVLPVTDGLAEPTLIRGDGHAAEAIRRAMTRQRTMYGDSYSRIGVQPRNRPSRAQHRPGAGWYRRSPLRRLGRTVSLVELRHEQGFILEPSQIP